MMLLLLVMMMVVVMVMMAVMAVPVAVVAHGTGVAVAAVATTALALPSFEGDVVLEWVQEVQRDAGGVAVLEVTELAEEALFPGPNTHEPPVVDGALCQAREGLVAVHFVSVAGGQHKHLWA